MIKIELIDSEFNLILQTLNKRVEELSKEISGGKHSLLGRSNMKAEKICIKSIIEGLEKNKEVAESFVEDKVSHNVLTTKLYLDTSEFKKELIDIENMLIRLGNRLSGVRNGEGI